MEAQKVSATKTATIPVQKDTLSKNNSQTGIGVSHLEIADFTADTKFISLKDDEPHNQLEFYNEDGTLWKTINYKNNFEDKDLRPFMMDTDDGFKFAFRLVETKSGFYKVLVNEKTNAKKFIKISDPNYKLQTAQEHILSVACIDFDGETNPLHKLPDSNSEMVKKDSESLYYPMKIDGDWLQVQNDNNDKFWLRWCDGKGRAIIQLYYDI